MLQERHWTPQKGSNESKKTLMEASKSQSEMRSFIYVDLTKVFQITFKTALCPKPPAQRGAPVRTISPFRTNPLIASLTQR